MISPVSGLKAPPDAGAPSLEPSPSTPFLSTPFPSTLPSSFASPGIVSASEFVLEWGVSPFGGELKLEEGGSECIDDSEDLDVESDEAIIAS